jgi:hypothetical protein
MSDAKIKSRETGAVSPNDEREVDNVVRHYGITREQARQLIRQHGNSRRELEAAAGQLRAKRMF